MICSVKWMDRQLPSPSLPLFREARKESGVGMSAAVKMGRIKTGLEGCGGFPCGRPNLETALGASRSGLL